MSAHHVAKGGPNSRPGNNMLPQYNTNDLEVIPRTEQKTAEVLALLNISAKQSKTN